MPGTQHVGTWVRTPPTHRGGGGGGSLKQKAVRVKGLFRTNLLNKGRGKVRPCPPRSSVLDSKTLLHLPYPRAPVPLHLRRPTLHVGDGDVWAKAVRCKQQGSKTLIFFLGGRVCDRIMQQVTQKACFLWSVTPEEIKDWTTKTHAQRTRMTAGGLVDREASLSKQKEVSKTADWTSV